MPEWLKDAVFYEIYPQSFFDTNGDGIGDLNGIKAKLDYIDGLGCNAIWINPCFDSPFKDAGYDVRDYKKIAARYGTNDDMKALLEAAHAKGIHILLDLVAGHTSEEHAWFRQSQKAEKNPYTNRYIWTDQWFKRAGDLPFVAGEAERAATYITNFFKCQPALNYGFLKPEAAWQLPIDHPDCIATREALKDVMRFWLDMGCDGFRVDMASSLVKHDDTEKTGTSLIWKEIRSMLDKEYPEAALIAEWSIPRQSLPAGFHCDFYLSQDASYTSLFWDYDWHKNGGDNSYFRRDADSDILNFLPNYEADYLATRDIGYISMVTCNHDTRRPRFNLSLNEMKLVYAFIFTMPGVPFLYYGDEIGMRYLDLPTKEGGFYRTGSRTPMQWESGRPSLGFSTSLDTYLPVDNAPDAPTVSEQEKDAESLLNYTRSLIHLRHSLPALQSGGSFEPVFAKKGSRLFVYRRGNLLLAVNPSDVALDYPLKEHYEPIFQQGKAVLSDQMLRMGGQSFVILKPTMR